MEDLGIHDGVEAKWYKPYYIDVNLVKEKLYVVRLYDNYSVELPKQYWMQVFEELGYHDAMNFFRAELQSMPFFERFRPRKILCEWILRYMAFYQPSIEERSLDDVHPYREVWEAFDKHPTV